MAIDVNMICMTGFLERNAEIEEMKNGSKIMKFRLCFKTLKKNGEQWVEDLNTVEWQFFGKKAEEIHQYMGVNRKVCVQGRLRQEKWEQDGEERRKLSFIAENVVVMGIVGNSARTSASQALAPVSAPKAISGEDFTYNDDSIPF